jgi:hypothetical protein
MLLSLFSIQEEEINILMILTKKLGFFHIKALINKTIFAIGYVNMNENIQN